MASSVYIERFTVPDPDVTYLPVTKSSYPLNMACRQTDPIDLGKYGYVEEEYLVSGPANVYAWKGTSGRPRIRSSNCPYCTRIIVRKPASASSFSGSVMVEMMHGGCKIDNPSIGWGTSFEHILESGDAYVGISVAGTTFKALKEFDSARYAALEMKNPLPPEERGPYGNMASSPDQLESAKGGVMEDDPGREKGLDMDMVSQVAAMIKRGKKGTPFHGYGAERAYLIGVTFGEIPCYVSAVLPYSMLVGDTPVYDGVIIYMSGRAGNLNREEDALSWDDPRCKCGGPVPIVRIQTAGDLRGTEPHPLWACMYRCGNSDEPGNLSRCYEVAGASLRFCARSDVMVYPGPEEIKAAGVDNIDHESNSLRGYRGPGPRVSVMQHILACTFRNLKDWTEKGIPLPAAPYIEMTGGYPDADFVLDDHGNQKGGVRSHYVDVPAATYLDNGDIIPFTSKKLSEMYGTRENWLRRVSDRLDRMVKERWILEAGAKALFAEAERMPWTEDEAPAPN